MLSLFPMIEPVLHLHKQFKKLWWWSKHGMKNDCSYEQCNKQTINTNNVLYPYRHIYTKSLAYE